jgi:hypothetical protein
MTWPTRRTPADLATRRAASMMCTGLSTSTTCTRYRAKVRVGKSASKTPPCDALALRLSDVKVLAQAQPLELLGEGELERIRVHDLNENEDYELTADAFVLLK